LRQERRERAEDQLVFRRGKGGATEAQDLLGTRIPLSRQGLAYGEEFAPFDEMDGSRPTSRNL